MKLVAKILAGLVGSFCMFKLVKKIKDKRAEHKATETDEQSQEVQEK